MDGWLDVCKLGNDETDGAPEFIVLGEADIDGFEETLGAADADGILEKDGKDDTVGFKEVLGKAETVGWFDKDGANDSVGFTELLGKADVVGRAETEGAADTEGIDEVVGEDDRLGSDEGPKVGAPVVGGSSGNRTRVGFFVGKVDGPALTDGSNEGLRLG